MGGVPPGPAAGPPGRADLFARVGSVLIPSGPVPRGRDVAAEAAPVPVALEAVLSPARTVRGAAAGGAIVAQEAPGEPGPRKRLIRKS